MKPASSCRRCFAWGVHDCHDHCKACVEFAKRHHRGDCAGCQRSVPLKKKYCRLCWTQASLDAKGTVTVLEPYLEALTHHQLFFSDMRRAVRRRRADGEPPRRNYRDRVAPRSVVVRWPAWTQLRLVDVPRDFHSFDRPSAANLDNPWLLHAQSAACHLAEARGWPPRTLHDVDRVLVILLSNYASGDRVRYSEIEQLAVRGLTAKRPAEVLDYIGLLDDDRRAPFEDWLQRNVDGLPAGIACDVESWLRALHDGSPRTKPRSPGTVWGYASAANPVLLEWSRRYDHLREVDRDDVLAAADRVHGWQRCNTLTALRSLFQHCKKQRSIFRDPTSRIRVGRHPDPVLLPLEQSDLDQAVAVVTTPEHRLVLALVAVHAARPVEIRNLTLDDIELGDRQLVIGGHSRRLDDPTRAAIIGYLDYRRARWPNTANPHVIITQHTANDHGRVSGGRLAEAFFGLKASLDRVRMDRQLEEALFYGPDPLHLAVIFGVSEKTAIRYATAARQLLDPKGETR